MHIVDFFSSGDGVFGILFVKVYQKPRPQKRIFLFWCIKNPFLDKNNKKLFKRGRKNDKKNFKS